MLESQLHGDNCFLTLTYSDDHLPKMNVSGCGGTGTLATLEPKDLQNWLKRFRKEISPTRIRFYAVGEYGNETWRPHYHVILFGYPTCSRGRTGLGMGNPDWSRCCVRCKLVGETWGLGKVYLGTLETHSAQYVAGYVTKKMNRRDDFRLLGREPEFCRMSNRPGIGHDFMHEVASAFLQFNLEQDQSDVPVTLAHGKRQLPLGRYLRMKLRKMVGRDEKTPQQVLDQIKEEMRPLRETQFATTTRTSLKSVVLDTHQGKRARFHSRNAIFKGRRSL